ncbi:hypothetical protein ACSSZE_05940 [Acidithiobacillus caldus]
MDDFRRSGAYALSLPSPNSLDRGEGYRVLTRELGRHIWVCAFEEVREPTL